MYPKIFWDNIYKKHYEDAPWMADSWKGDVLHMIEQFIPPKAKSLLDYGCGNGYMGHYFYEKGLKVDLSDISDYLIDKLRIKFSDTDMGIILTDSPDVLTGRKYDVIIAWSLFHHIEPKDWSGFLDGFWRILKRKGVLVIGGWDISDDIIRMDGKKARFTGEETWYINDLVNYVTDDFRILKNDTLEFFVPPFTSKRVQRYFILEKRYRKNKQ